MKDYKTYNCTLENFKECLEEYGVCVIPDVFYSEECVALRNDIWSDLETLHKNRFQLADNKTWHHFYDMFPLHAMLIQHFSIAHMQSVWNIRQDPRIGHIFETLWGTDKLLSSFDGISINLPPEDTNRGWYLGNDWMHTDQSPIKKGLHCIQGLVNLYPVNDGDATLTILESSHKYHEEFFDTIDYHENNDWFRLQEGHREFFEEKGCHQYCVKAPIGSVVLWDSRTFHQGIEAQKDRENKNFRMVVYTCLIPRDRFSEKDLATKKKAFEERRVTNHWGTKMFPKMPRTYGRSVPDFEPVSEPELSEYGKTLLF